MRRRWVPGVLAAAGVFVVLAGLLDDLVRVVFWELLASAALLVWYGPARRLWGRSRRE